jgi:hypothetical protein
MTPKTAFLHCLTFATILVVGCSRGSTAIPIVLQPTTQELSFGQADNGLQLGLAAVGADACGNIAIEVHLRNVSDQPLTVLSPSSGDPFESFEVRGDDRILEDHPHWIWLEQRISPVISPFSSTLTTEDFVKIAPGQNMVVRGTLRHGSSSEVNYSQMTVVYTHANDWPEWFVPIQGSFQFQSPLARVGPPWTGKATSGTLTFQVVSPTPGN